MGMKALLTFIALLASGCMAQESCKSGRPVKTPKGDLVLTKCVDANHNLVRKYVSVAGVKLLQSTYLSEKEFSSDKTKWVFSGESNSQTGCASQLYLLDVDRSPPKVISFGVKKACNEFHWASWGVKKSVIVIKNNVSFKYENGKLTPPPGGEKLWKSVEPPHAGPGMVVEDAVGFVEELSLPK